MTVRFIRAAARLCTLIFVALALVAPATTWAQSRSDTGRHKPEPPPVTEEDTSSKTKGKTSGPDSRRWHLGVCGGVQGGSDLFRVQVIDGPPVPWDPATGGGFQSARFTATLDRNFGFGLFLTRDLGSIWSVKADLGYSRMDVAAEALVGQTGAVFLFDRISVFNLGLGFEARLAQATSYPFVQGSILFSHLGPVRADALEQTNWGGRLGLGYFHSLQEIWGLRFEARLSGTGFSVGDYVPQADTFEQPVLEYTTEDHLLFFEFLIGIQANI
jgi:hypothetical protein